MITVTDLVSSAVQGALICSQAKGTPNAIQHACSASCRWVAPEIRVQRLHQIGTWFGPESAQAKTQTRKRQHKQNHKNIFTLVNSTFAQICLTSSARNVLMQKVKFGFSVEHKRFPEKPGSQVSRLDFAENVIGTWISSEA